MPHTDGSMTYVVTYRSVYYSYVIDFIGVPDGIRTRVTAVKGRCPDHWTTGTRAAFGRMSSDSRLTTAGAPVKARYYFKDGRNGSLPTERTLRITFAYCSRM
jgi:hypothetical protein